MGIVNNVLNFADDIVRGGVDNQAIKYAQKGFKRTAVKANKSVAEQNAFGRALSKAKGSKIGHILLDGTGKRTTVKQALDPSTIEELKNISMTAKQAALKGGEDAQKNLDIANRASTISQAGVFNRSAKLGDRVSDYYNHSDYGTKRKVITAGAVGLGMLGGRFATGGDLTHNGNGEKDIIGVPFL